MNRSKTLRLSRRDFLKGIGAATAALGLSGSLGGDRALAGVGGAEPGSREILTSRTGGSVTIDIGTHAVAYYEPPNYIYDRLMANQ
jgi:hypothetical protein